VDSVSFAPRERRSQAEAARPAAVRRRSWLHAS
jgi:hypothetical protein